jgi:hypothetical protein
MGNMHTPPDALQRHIGPLQRVTRLLQRTWPLNTKDAVPLLCMYMALAAAAAAADLERGCLLLL